MYGKPFTEKVQGQSRLATTLLDTCLKYLRLHYCVEVLSVTGFMKTTANIREHIKVCLLMILRPQEMYSKNCTKEVVEEGARKKTSMIHGENDIVR